jgi:hypothetical protein
MLIGLAMVSGTSVADPRRTDSSISFLRPSALPSFEQSSKDKLENDMRALIVGAARCKDIEKHLAAASIPYSVSDGGDGTRSYHIMIREPTDNSLADNFFSRSLSATLEVRSCVLTSKDVRYNYK